MNRIRNTWSTYAMVVGAVDQPSQEGDVEGLMLEHQLVNNA